MRGFKRSIMAAATFSLLVGCELIAGLEDHNFAPDTTGGDGSATDGSSGEAAAGPAFTLTAVPSLTLLPGASAPVNITITRENGFTDAVNVTVSGLPAGATTSPLSFVSTTTSSALTIAVAATTPQSLSHLSIDGTTADGKVSASAKMDLIVRGPAGSLDLLYGDQGVYTSVAVSANTGALDANDNLLVGGDVAAGGIVAARILPNGTLDSTFAGGIAAMTFLPGPDLLVSVMPLATKSIVYGARLDPFLGPPSGTEYFRIKSDGTFDTTYSPDASVGWGDNIGSSVRAITEFAADPSGRVIGAGQDTDGTHFQAYVERRAADGSPDPTFASGLHPLGTTSSNALGIAVQTDGKIVLGCESTDTNGTGMALLRLLDTGAADTTFGVNGYVKPAIITAGDGSFQVLLQPDGKILLLGSKTGVSLVARYNTDGSFDTTFGQDGVASIPAVSNVFTSFALQSDGKIVLLRSRILTGDAGNYNTIELERLTIGGAPDPSFGTGGVVEGLFGAPEAGGTQARVVLIQSDGRILALTNTFLSAGQGELTVARFWP
jgi:uncharacterized delta-60 repeat protein